MYVTFNTRNVRIYNVYLDSTHLDVVHAKGSSGDDIFSLSCCAGPGRRKCQETRTPATTRAARVLVPQSEPPGSARGAMG